MNRRECRRRPASIVTIQRNDSQFDDQFVVIRRGSDGGVCMCVWINRRDEEVSDSTWEGAESEDDHC